MLVSSTLVLGLSTCAFALHARYDPEYKLFGKEGVGSSSGDESKSSTADLDQTSASYGQPWTVTSLNGHSTYVPRPSLVHNASHIPYPTGTGSYNPVKPGPTGTPNVSCAPYWLEDIKHQGVASFNPTPDSYQVFRNVKDYGAIGDGIADDTAAIQLAIADGDRCAPGVCESATNSPAVVYFPGGTYLISSSIIDYYYTQVRLHSIDDQKPPS